MDDTSRKLVTILIGALMAFGVAPLDASAQAHAPAVSCAASAGLSPEMTHVWVVVPAHADSEMQATATEVVRSLRVAYGRDMVTTTRQLTRAADAVPHERRVVIDDDVAVPSNPQWFAHDPSTVFLHWTTAVDDVELLINDGSAKFCVVSPATASSSAPVGPPTLNRVAPSPGESRSAQWLLGDENSILTGYSDSTSYEVDLPAGWTVVGNGHLTTQVIPSEIARDDMSLRFDIDGRPVSTWTLADDATVTVPLASEYFADGFTLEALTTTPIIEESDCRDPRHVGRWVDVGNPVIETSIAPGEIDVARAVSGLGPVSQLTGLPLGLAMPANATANTLQIAGALTAAIGHHGAPTAWQVSSGASALASGSGVVIIPEPDKPATISVEVKGLDVVLTLAGNEADLVQLASALGDLDRLLFFHDQVVSIDDIPAAAASFVPEVFRFEDAGYDDRTLRGTGAKSLIYRVHIPAGVPPDTATLALYGTYTPALAEDESTVSVRINGNEEQILAVLDPSGQLEVLHTIAPANLRPGLNYVKVTVQLGDQLDGHCSTNDSRWFTVSSASALGSENDGSPRDVRLGVEDARFALAASHDLNDADVVVADAPSDDELAVALGLIAQLGERAQGGSPRLVTDSNADTRRHLVLVGVTGDRELLTDLPYVDSQSSVGVVVAIPSPHTPGRLLLAFTGGTEDATRRAIEAGLSSAVNDISGPYALVGIDNVRAVDSDSRAANPPDVLAYQDVDQPARGDGYEAWLLEQSARIQAANAPQTDARRTLSVALLLVFAAAGGLLWIQRSRKSDVAGGH